MSFGSLSKNTNSNTSQNRKKAEEPIIGEHANPIFTSNANEVDTTGFQTMRKNKKSNAKKAQKRAEAAAAAAEEEEAELEAVVPAFLKKEKKEKTEKVKSDKPKTEKAAKTEKPKSDKPRKQKDGESKENGENKEKKVKKEKKEKEHSELKVKAPLETGRALVKAVPSGDTVVLQVLTTGAEKRPDITLSLSSLTAPRLGRYFPSANPTKDQAFAWESRDFLRELVIGKVVSYVIENKNPKNNRDYGVIFLGENNVCKEIAANGWATVFKPTTGREPQGDLLDLVNLSAEAEKLGLGIFQTEENIRNASMRNFISTYDIFAVYERFRLKQAKSLNPTKAFVEQVKTGSQIRLWFSEVIKGQSVYYNLLVRIAGIECPAPQKEGEKDVPFFNEAKEFTEQRILHRVVDVFFQGIDISKTITVKVAYGENVLSEDLLREGLAKVNDAHQTPDLQTLIQCETEAKDAHLRLWENYVSPVTERQEVVKSDKEFIAKVREIISGTTIVVTDLSGNKKQINFSSLLPFKLDAPNEESLKEHIRRVGRETLRGLVGKKVRVVLDYVRQVQTGNKVEERPFYSVYSENTNVSKVIVERGLAQVVKHRQNEKRSPIYDQLLVAEKNAEKRGEGRYTKSLQQFRTVDLTPPPPTRPQKEHQDILKKAKQYFPFIRTNPGERLPCVIERVNGPGRYKIFVPKESCYLSFILQGIKTPQVKSDKKSEPFADEALEYSRDKCLQRDAEVTIEEQDKFGNFSGTIFVNKQNITTLLLRAGYASLRPGANNLPFYSEYLQAEDSAKKQNKKIWANWDEEIEQEKQRIQDEQDQAHRASASHVRKRRAVNVTVTDITDASHFYVQIKGDDLAKLETLSKQIQDAEKNIPSGWKPKSKDTVLAKSADGKWYRAKLRETIKVSDSEFKYVAHFIDYGKSETIKSEDLRPIDQGFLTLAPQAKECVLANVSTPKTSQDFGPESTEFFRKLVTGKTLLAVIEDREHDGKLYLTLGDTETNTHITAALLSNGYARINRRAIRSLPKTVLKLEEEEEKAKRDHLNLWQYGDISDDEEEDNNKRRRGKGRF